MDLANLHAFVVVADQGSFSLAAEQLHLTQPAVSKRIAALEQELEARLFDRIGRQVQLTEAGRTLLPRARRILAELEDGRRALRNLSGQVAGTLTIATSHHIGLHRLPPVLRAFAAHYPQVRLDMRFTDSELACEMVGRGEVELAVVTLPPQPMSGPIHTTPIWDDPLVVVVPPEHPLASFAPRVSPFRLAGHPAILPGEGTFTRDIVARLFEELGIRLSIAFSTNYMETIKMMVAVGLGWSVLPRAMLREGEELVALELEGLTVRRSLGVVQHTGHTLSNAARAMLGILLEQREYPAS
ncbi:MAG TPA: LysR family transcriptional regulator [Candidatus Competibacteraceae bacterium]|nr:LysR family transcriptional regulator [Candidatus Competibacteraceae bacterium]